MLLQIAPNKLVRIDGCTFLLVVTAFRKNICLC